VLKRYLLWLVAAGAVGAGGAALYLLSVFPRVRAPLTEAVEATPARLARGTYLAEHVLLCSECHADRDWTVFSAPSVPPVGAGRAECLGADAPMAGVAAEFPGSICFPNITADKETGVGAWTDGELLRAVREGVDRNGHALFPIMPYFIFRHLSEEDARSLVVWIRSLPPVVREHPAKRVDFPVGLFIRLVPQPLAGPVAEPEADDPVAYGRYLATIGRCAFCHSPRRGQSPEPVPGLLFAGGNEFRGPFGIRRSSNLTPHPSGLGAMTREEFVALFRRHAAPAPVAPEQNTIMAWGAYAGMTDGDLGALYDYLRTVPPVPTPAG
jgi:hypothetical protein